MARPGELAWCVHDVMPSMQLSMAHASDTSRSCPLQPIFLQSFETKNLASIRNDTDLPLVQLYSDVNVRLHVAILNLSVAFWCLAWDRKCPDRPECSMTVQSYGAGAHS